MSAALLMAAAMVFAVALVGVVGFLLSRAPSDERVSDHWIGSHSRDRRDDA